MNELMDIILQAPAVSLEEILTARDERAARQRAFLASDGGTPRPLVSVTLNIPGERKAHPLAERAFGIARAALLGRLARRGMPVEVLFESTAKTGFEGLYAVDGDATAVKALAVAVEETHPIGRLFDIDVLDGSGGILRGADTGRTERACIVCGKPVWACARSRAHSPEELALRTAEMLRDYLDGEYADHIAELAIRALLYEVIASPKPGLVDRNNNGAHRDMDLFTFAASAASLTAYFRGMTARGLRFRGEAGTMLPSLRLPGMLAEDRMFAATGGVNTHKGLVFSLGIFCAAAGFLRGSNKPLSPENILGTSAAIAADAEKDFAEAGGISATHGLAAHARFGLTGIRGEAARGYPAILHHGLPAFLRMTEAGHSLNDAGIAALLHLMAHVEDTNIVSRSDAGTLSRIQAEIRTFLEASPDMPAILRFAAELDARFIRDNISPGGSADLLALVYFLFFVL